MTVEEEIKHILWDLLYARQGKGNNIDDATKRILELTSETTNGQS